MDINKKLKKNNLTKVGSVLADLVAGYEKR